MEIELGVIVAGEIERWGGGERDMEEWIPVDGGESE